jgi:rRNA maturation endonuclease Nob1
VEKAFGNKTEMKPTFIMKCTNCQALMLTTKGQKTKICPYCGARLDLSRAQKVASAENPIEASRVLRKMKSEKGRQNQLL